ncbi:hypothetical protein HYALB_00001563 [Hymenoscyphus albidus]|uniref:Uncharacterized protein n=1 Tax=Hymenoscyphus albidus TaxID=595503 RepID=A0A9N9LDS0_9HELO|nr:hypothetical protein HYALB_00001563 [Hymenoscyphus albidus]
MRKAIRSPLRQGSNTATHLSNAHHWENPIKRSASTAIIVIAHQQNQPPNTQTSRNQTVHPDQTTITTIPIEYGIVRWPNAYDFPAMWCVDSYTLFSRRSSLCTSRTHATNRLGSVLGWPFVAPPQSNKAPSPTPNANRQEEEKTKKKRWANLNISHPENTKVISTRGELQNKGSDLLHTRDRQAF